MVRWFCFSKCLFSHFKKVFFSLFSFNLCNFLQGLNPDKWHQIRKGNVEINFSLGVKLNIQTQRDENERKRAQAFYGFFKSN